MNNHSQEMIKFHRILPNMSVGVYELGCDNHTSMLLFGKFHMDIFHSANWLSCVGFKGYEPTVNQMDLLS